jgi:hypothetical protein
MITFYVATALPSRPGHPADQRLGAIRYRHG